MKNIITNFNRSLFASLFFFVLILSFIGCRGNKSSSENLQNGSFTPVIKKLDPAFLNNVLTDRKGKMLLVNLWSTWSDKSMQQLDSLKVLYREYNSNTDFLIINIDLSSDIDPKVIPFLKKMNLNIPVYVVNASEGKAIMKMLNPGWSGNIPVTYLYDKTGKQRAVLQGIQTNEKIGNSINSLLN